MCAHVCARMHACRVEGERVPNKRTVSANDFCERQDFLPSQKLSLPQFLTYLLNTVRKLVSVSVESFDIESQNG